MFSLHTFFREIMAMEKKNATKEQKKSMAERQTKWIEYYFNICKTVSSKSKDPSTKVGAVIIGQHGQILSTGFNGFPIGVNDNLMNIVDGEERQSERYINRELKYLFVSHAEENAIALAARSGTNLFGSTLFVTPIRPCARCARLIIQAGIKEVFALEETDEETLKRWELDIDVSQKMFNESGVNLITFKNLDLI